MNNWIATLLVSILLGACASKDLSIKGEPIGPDRAKLDVTMNIIEDYSDTYNLLLQINFRNNEGRWIRIDTVEADLSNKDNQPFNIVLGEDLKTWGNAKAEEKQIYRQNKELLTGGAVVTTGALAVLAILNGNQDLANAGLIGASGAVGYGAYSKITDQRNTVERPRYVPEDHLYQSFAVPSMTMVRKWLLVNLPTGKVGRQMVLRMKTIEGEELTYVLNLSRKI